MPQNFVFINSRSGRVDVWLPLVFTDAQKTSRHESTAQDARCTSLDSSREGRSNRLAINSAPSKRRIL
jgi:hypothetical protein